MAILSEEKLAKLHDEFHPDPYMLETALGFSEIFSTGIEGFGYSDTEIQTRLFLFQYVPSQWFSGFFPAEEKNFSNEGWKVHVSIDTFEEYIFVFEHVLPLLRKEKVAHKIVHPGKFIDFNAKGDSQAGKILTIYPDSLEFFSLFDEKVKTFLLHDNNLRITTDKHLGGKVYVRYSGFSNDYIKNPFTGKDEFFGRNEEFYKPSWIEEPLSLEELFFFKKEA